MSGEAALYGSSLLYTIASGPTVWRETPAGRAPLSQGNTWGVLANPSLTVANSAPWALACRSSSTQTLLARVGLGGGPVATPFAVSAPPGASFISPGYVTTFDPACPSVDGQGYGFQFFTTPTGLQAFRTETGTSWEALGAPMGQVTAIGAFEAGGTYLLGGSASPGGTLNGPDGGAGVSLGAQMQVVRSGAAASLTLPPADWTNQTYPAYFMTYDGGCIAYFEGGALTVADARAGVIHTTRMTADTANDGLAIGWTNIPGDGQIWADLGY
jgi:hypothetical protein